MTQLDQTPTHARENQTNQTQYLLQMLFKLHGFRFWKRWKNLCIRGRDNLQREKDKEKKKKMFHLRAATEKRAIFGETNLAAVEVNKPDVVWYFELGFVEEETGWDTNNVRSGSKKELKKNPTAVRQKCRGTMRRLSWGTTVSHLFSRGHAGWQKGDDGEHVLQRVDHGNKGHDTHR